MVACFSLSLKDQYISQHKDQLGNVRVSFARNSAGVLEIADSNDYYPFGMNHLKTGTAFFRQGSYKNNKYNSKELQETGMYSYGWRDYMPDIARWNGIDQLAENYLSTSTYAYVANNPVSYADVDGRWFNEDGTIDTSGYANSFVNTRAYMNQSFGQFAGQGGGGTSAQVLVDKAFGFGGDWYNTGAGFAGSMNIGLGYDGSYTSLNTDYAEGGIGERIYDIPGVTISGRGNGFGEGSYNSFMMGLAINNAAGSWNLSQARTTLYDAVENTKVGQSVSAAEKFLFLELPASFAGGEFLAAGWRAANLSRYLCGPMGRLTNGLIKICFTEGTLVATEKGSKKIENIKEGDLVWSYNEETSKKELKKVVELSRNTSSSLVKISVNGTEIICTPEHPFYVKGNWVEAKNLTKGMLLTTFDGATYPVESIKFLEEKVKVYNFEVEGNHNYYVSEKRILVHNDCDIIWKGFSKGELNIHFLKHGAEFGEITQSQYLKLAKGFASEAGEHIEQQTVGKFLIKYNKNTQDILVGRMDLREIRTFYRANPAMTKINPFQDALDFAATLTK